MKFRVIALILGLLLFAGCGGGDTAADDLISTEDVADEKEGSQSGDDAATTTTTEAADDTTTTEAVESTTSTTEADLEGQAWDGFFDADDVVAVVGVRHDDVLNIRARPGASEEIVTFALPTEDEVVATGNAWLLPTSIWYEVRVDGIEGWANAAFLGYLGGVNDDTSKVVDELGTVSAETMVELGEIVADTYASTEPQSRVVPSVAPAVGDLGTITYDVIGIGDDALTGFRVHVFGAPLESGEGFGLKSVETTIICTRGLSGELCT